MYGFKGRVRFSETDLNGIIKFESIVNYMQDCSTFHSEDLGVGINTLKKYNKTWMICSWYIEVLRYPVFGEKIEVFTQPYNFNKMFGNRSFIIKSDAGETLVKADSKWVLVDTVKKRIIKISDEDLKPYGLSQKTEMKPVSKKIQEPSYKVNSEKIFVDKSYIDSNGHMNNEKYIEVSMRYLPNNFKNFTSMRIEYRNSAVLGDSIFIKSGELDGRYIVCLSNEGNKKYSLAEFVL